MEANTTHIWYSPILESIQREYFAYKNYFIKNYYAWVMTA